MTDVVGCKKVALISGMATWYCFGNLFLIFSLPDFNIDCEILRAMRMGKSY